MCWRELWQFLPRPAKTGTPLADAPDGAHRFLTSRTARATVPQPPSLLRSSPEPQARTAMSGRKAIISKKFASSEPLLSYNPRAVRPLNPVTSIALGAIKSFIRGHNQGCSEATLESCTLVYASLRRFSD